MADAAVYTLATAAASEIDIRKSRFIGIVMPVANRHDAMQELERIRTDHRSATHVCWALLAGGQSGMSDDGEPSGTAGRPIMEVLRHHQLDGVLAAVVRYYGGIQLGAGGLVRAYTEAVATALKQTERVLRVAMTELLLTVPYADEAHLRRWLQQHDYQLLDSRHDEQVQLRIRLPEAGLDAARQALSRLSPTHSEQPADDAV